MTFPVLILTGVRFPFLRSAIPSDRGTTSCMTHLWCVLTTPASSLPSQPLRSTSKLMSKPFLRERRCHIIFQRTMQSEEYLLHPITLRDVSFPSALSFIAPYSLPLPLALFQRVTQVSQWIDRCSFTAMVPMAPVLIPPLTTLACLSWTEVWSMPSLIFVGVGRWVDTSGTNMAGSILAR
jgi:hypothetical protein